MANGRGRAARRSSRIWPYCEYGGSVRSADAQARRRRREASVLLRGWGHSRRAGFGSGNSTDPAARRCTVASTGGPAMYFIGIDVRRRRARSASWTATANSCARPSCRAIPRLSHALSPTPGLAIERIGLSWVVPPLGCLPFVSFVATRGQNYRRVTGGAVAGAGCALTAITKVANPHPARQANAKYGIGADRYRGRTNYCRGGVKSMRVAGFSHGSRRRSLKRTDSRHSEARGWVLLQMPLEIRRTLKRTAPNRTVLFKLKRDQEAGRATATSLFPSGSRR